jgi:hypothetical protein
VETIDKIGGLNKDLAFASARYGKSLSQRANLELLKQGLLDNEEGKQSQ